MDERTRLATIENKQRKIRGKISEIEEKSAGGNYIYRGEPDTYGQNPFNGKVSSSLWRECKKKMREVDFNIKYVQEEILKNALGYGLNPSEDKFELMVPPATLRWCNQPYRLHDRLPYSPFLRLRGFL